MLRRGTMPSRDDLRCTFLLPLLIVAHFTLPALALIANTPVSQLQYSHIPSPHNLDTSPVPANGGNLEAFHLECFFCKRAVNKYRARVEKGTDAAEQAIGGLCKELKLQKDDVVRWRHLVRKWQIHLEVATACTWIPVCVF